MMRPKKESEREDEEPKRRRMQPTTMGNPNRAKDSEIAGEQPQVTKEVQKKKISRATMGTEAEQKAAAYVEDSDERILHILSE